MRFAQKNKKVFTTTNFPAASRAAFQRTNHFLPHRIQAVATVMHEQDTVDIRYENTRLKAPGRHDPCVLPRAVPMWKR